MRPRTKKVLLVALTATAAFLAAAAVAAARIVEPGPGDICSPEEAPPAPVAIVPGAGLRPDGEPSAILADRVEVAVELYLAGRVPKLLLSGDHGTRDYDEPRAMARYAQARGVPPEDLFLDHAGFDTWATIYRARDVFGVHRALVVSQEFHLRRALYFARELGIQATGVRADLRPYARRGYYAVREAGARMKAVVVASVRPRPRFLGPRISLDGDGRVTRDGSE